MAYCKTRETSRLVAKVDNAAVQDGFQLYHHLFVFTGKGEWGVVQQGMAADKGWARRYHWLGEGVTDPVCEPHAAVCSQGRLPTMNMVAAESSSAREVVADLGRSMPEKVLAEFERARQEKSLVLQAGHPVPRSAYLNKALLKVYERQPQRFTQLLSVEGVGPATIRALALVSEVVYGAPPSFRDPARYSFAHGGKDGHPYPVAREVYERSIQVLRRAVGKARLGRGEQMAALKRLASLENAR